MVLRLFTKPHCEKCDDLKKILDNKSVAYEAKNTQDPVVIEELKPLLVGINNPMLPVLALDDDTVITNDMGIYRTLREKGIV